MNYSFLRFGCFLLQRLPLAVATQMPVLDPDYSAETGILLEVPYLSGFDVLARKNSSSNAAYSESTADPS
uniref:Secreted protein n=1 Tax=Syphacia muris TaxID=451379 RepID=A0A0N5AIU2_9BILA